jgi:hypothetical protein
MTINDYYKILGLDPKATVEEIKTAYRQKARLYHPDINHDPDAKDRFISATEAYEFLISNHDKTNDDETAFREAMEDWRKYRQDRSRRKATAYARASYQSFRKTKFYRTTRIYDGTRIIYGFIISILVITYTIYGYIYRLHYPYLNEKPSLFSFLLLLTIGLLFLAFTIVFLIAYIQESRKRKKKC